MAAPEPRTPPGAARISAGDEPAFGDPRSIALFDTVRQLRGFRGPVLIQGETGVGKSLLVDVLHSSGPYAELPLHSLDCARWADSPDEPQPFREGDGIVLLDKVDLASAPLQRWLLAAFDCWSGHQFPLIISTSTRSLKPLVECDEFLPELYYRLCGVLLDVPPLRERFLDIRILAEHFAGQAMRTDVLERLHAHDWPGNVLEMQSVMATALIRSKGRAIRPSHLPLRMSRSRPAGTSLPEMIAELELREIRSALERTGNNKVKAAKLLGVSRKGLIDRLKRLGLWEEFGRTED